MSEGGAASADSRYITAEPGVGALEAKSLRNPLPGTVVARHVTWQPPDASFNALARSFTINACNPRKGIAKPVGEGAGGMVEGAAAPAARGGAGHEAAGANEGG